MPIAQHILDSMGRSSLIRRMFEEGIRMKAQFGEDNVFDFSIGNPDIPPPAKFFDALIEICSSNKSAGGLNEHGYMPNAGYTETREAIAQWLSAEHGVSLKGDHVIMTCGAAGGLNVVFKTLLNPDEEVIVPKPYFPEYDFYVGNHNGKTVLVESNKDFSLNIENINSAINDKTRAILINSPNNPTGRVYSESEIKSLSELLADQLTRHGRCIYLVSDEPYREIVYNGITVPSILKYYQNSILVNSFSKTLSIAGERIGYVAINPLCDDAGTLISGLILCNRTLGYINAPALMQRIIVKILDTSVNTELYKKRRDIFIDGLRDAGYRTAVPEGAFYLFPESPMKNDVEFVKHLQKYNILVVPGSGFGGPGYFRISYAVPQDIIERSIPKFREALESLK